MLEGKRNLVFIVISFCLVFLAANMVFAEEKYVYPRKTKYEGEKSMWQWFLKQYVRN